jgi:O-acetyl-ADP-ribose deacetylase (regulator of RNase III)
MITYVDGSILDANTQFIAHQCNCITRCFAGLADTIFTRYPEANAFDSRQRRGVLMDTPGTVIQEGRVLNMFAQFFPSMPILQSRYDLVHRKAIVTTTTTIDKYFSNCPQDVKDTLVSYVENETFEQRLKWFQQCLYNMLKIPNLKSVAFPYKIGCGMAGGYWTLYKQELQKFASQTSCAVVIYKYTTPLSSTQNISDNTTSTSTTTQVATITTTSSIIPSPTPTPLSVVPATAVTKVVKKPPPREAALKAQKKIAKIFAQQ